MVIKPAAAPLGGRGL